MRVFVTLAVIATLVGSLGRVSGTEQGEPTIRLEDIRGAQRIVALEWTQAEMDSMRGDLEDYAASYRALRTVMLPNAIPPALRFEPNPVGAQLEAGKSRVVASRSDPIDGEFDVQDLAFATVGQLAELIRTRRVSSLELTTMYLERLKRYGPALECVVTLTEERALARAKKADTEIAAGHYRGPLHGIPYGAKDLLAIAGYPTTWGAEPFRDQILDDDATVIERLDVAGAVLVAKLTLGALAWGDVWYGGMTRSPWDTAQGSSGSSAGSAAATSAGLVAFSIGSETWGSIVSPSTRCGVTGLRPTFGRVSRTGAMALSWTMDKIGPICRSVEDCALVLESIMGPDGIDDTAVDAPFVYDSGLDITSLRIGYVKTLFEGDYENRERDIATLDALRTLGVDLIPIELPAYPVEALSLILTVEAAAAFDDLTRSNRDDLLVRQIRNAWPNVFRAARHIPAVEYIQANRIRHLLVQEMGNLDVDVYVAPSFEGSNLLLTNLTGHPCVVVPNGFDAEGNPVSISFIGRLYGEGTLLAVAKAYQDASGYTGLQPPMFRE